MRIDVCSRHRFVVVLFPVFIAEASAVGLVWWATVSAAFGHLG